MVSRPDAGHVRADRFDDARPLVPQDGGQGRRVDAVADDGVGVADAGGDHPDPGLVGPEIIQLELLERQRLALLARDRRGNGWHALTPGPGAYVR
jgi:hypothetical protein